MNQLNLVALGATREVLDEVKKTLPALNKKAKKIKYKKGMEVECFQIIENLQRELSKIIILMQMKSNDNQNQLYIDAEKFLNMNAPKDNDLKKKIYETISMEEINKIAKENNFDLIPTIFINFENTLKGFISNKTIFKMLPSLIKISRISKKSDKISNAYKTFTGKLLVENKDKTNEEILDLAIKHEKEKQTIYKSTEADELKLDNKAHKVMKRILKIKKSPNAEYDTLNTFGLYEVFGSVTGIYKSFEPFMKRNKELNKTLLEKKHGKGADGFNLVIDNIKSQPTLEIEELKKMYIDALAKFDPKIAKFAKEKTTSDGRYDLSVRDSKPTDMAFTLMSEDYEGYISSHYDKTLAWQNTVAHEWGHSIQLERSKTNFNNMEWQPIVVEQPSILSEYIYLEHLKSTIKSPEAKIAVIDSIFEAGISRFYGNAIALKMGQKIIEEHNPKETPEQAYKHYDKLRKEAGYKDFSLKSKIDKYKDDLRKFSTPPIMLFQYLPAQAIAIIMYQKLKSGEIKLKDVYDSPLKTVDLIEYAKSWGIDMTSDKGFDILKDYFVKLLDEKEKLIKKVK